MFDWDEHNTRHIAERHGFTRGEAEEIFADPGRRVFPLGRVNDEERYLLIAAAIDGSVRAAVYTWRGAHIRVMSVRPASRKERYTYSSEVQGL